MRVVIDGRAIAWTGVGRYIRHLLAAFKELAIRHELVVAVPALSRALADGWPQVIVDGSYYSWREQLELGWKLRRLKADLWHFPHFNVPVWFDRPYVVTIHDTTRFFFPGQRHTGWWQQCMYEQVFGRAVARARAVITVSHTTRAELQRLPLNLPPVTTVIPEAVGADFLRPVTLAARRQLRARLKLAAPYVLFVGVWMSHKNIERLLLAFSRLRREQPELWLVITGQARAGYVDVPALARRCGVTERVCFPGFVEEALLPALYAESEALVFPSLYEGFGLPTLEAAAVGVPVVASTVSSLPEVLGQAAHYVNPEDVAGIAAGIKRVLMDQSYRTELVARGRRLVQDFSWQKTARQTLQIYDMLN